MQMKYQRGELSLLWTAVFAGVLALVLMGALFSMRYERNFFAEAWKSVMGSSAGKSLQAAEKSVQPAPAAIQKCVIDGKVVYSNVECAASNPTSAKVKLHDTQGIEAPKVPPAPAEQAGAPNMQDQMIEKAVGK